MGADAPSADPVVVFRSGEAASSPPDLRILHYNDVYHLDPSSAEPVGGAARFVTLCREYRHHERFRGQPELVTLFSGDVFNPSLESSVTKGSHMVPILNSIGTDCACVGNHDLDFGVLQFRHLAAQCRFPWLLANVLDPALGDGVPLGHARRTHMLTASNGLRIGLLGLAEREWLDTVNALPPGLVYRPAADVARELAPQLRRQGADLVVALTHMREPNDLKLAEDLAGELDLVLGGHDHFYAHRLVAGRTHVLRSGSDFKQLSYLELRRRPSSSAAAASRWAVDIWRRDVVRPVPEDPPTLALVDRLTARLKRSLERAVGWTAAPLDARFTTVRRRESNLANFVCDVMRHHYGADCALMAAGTVRGDQIYAPGPVRLKDITDCFPFEDPVVVLQVTGRGIRDALENGVSLYPALEGRFPQVSNIRFSFDPARPPGARLLSVELGGRPLDPDRVYTVVTRGYMARGKDGYTALLARSEGGPCEELVSEENGTLISTLLRQYFMALKVLRQWTRWGPSLQRHWGRVVDGVRASHPVLEPRTAAAAGQQRQGEHEDGAQRVDEDDGQRVDEGGGSTGPGGWAAWTPARLRERRGTCTPADDHSSDDEGHDGHDGHHQHHDTPVRAAQDAGAMDRELRIMRRVARKWCRLAGVRGRACDSLDEGAVEVDWTRAIAPQVEGRIQMVGGAGDDAEERR